MKRITFKQEHEAPILSGEKTATARWKDPLWLIGQERAAVTGKNGKPAFLTPAKDAFATLRCTGRRHMRWESVTDADVAPCGVTKDWYLKEKPDAQPWDVLTITTFEVVPVAPERALSAGAGNEMEKIS